MEHLTEKEYVVDSYTAHFKGRKNIVLYGVGANTKTILTETEDNNIIGLMDPLCEGSIVMGKPVFSIQEAARQASLIIIIARPSVVPIIFERIRELEVKHGIPIYNIEGERLIEREGAGAELLISDIPYWHCNSDALKQKIAKAQVISFDVFDTLIVRDVLRPADLFSFLERQLRKEGIQCEMFVIQRQSAESQLNQICVPTLAQIYDLLAEYYSWSGDMRNRAYEWELELEQRACHARNSMLSIYQYAQTLHKPIVLVSDMYLPQNQMQTLLEKAGYVGYDKLYVSCEYQATKESGRLFEIVRAEFSGTILHIGDNQDVDGATARTYGFLTYPVFSPYDMLLHSSLQKLAAKADTPEKMLTLGIVIRELFDDPFLLGPTKGVVEVKDLFTMGYAFIAPIITCFVRWMCREIWNQDYNMVLFCARDGYIIEQLYRKRQLAAQENLPKGIYFKTSRRAITVPSIKNEADILEILHRPYKTTKGELLSVRFGITPGKFDLEAADPADSARNAEDVTQYILKYKDAVLQNAGNERKAYLKYMEKVGLLKARRLVLYDFCSRGTIQYSLSKLLGSTTQIQGIYFATVDRFSMPYFQSQNVKSLFGNTFQYCTKHSLTENFMFVEATLLDLRQMVLYCKPDGTFQYAEEQEYRDISGLSMIQDGILSFDRAICEWEDSMDFSQEEDRDFSDKILGELFSNDCVRSEKIKQTVLADGAYDFERPYQVIR